MPSGTRAPADGTRSSAGIRARCNSPPFLLTGLTLATASGSEIKLWDQRTGLELLQLSRPAKYIMSFAFTEDGKTFRAVAQDTTGAELLEWTAAPLPAETAGNQP